MIAVNNPKEVPFTLDRNPAMMIFRLEIFSSYPISFLKLPAWDTFQGLHKVSFPIDGHRIPSVSLPVNLFYPNGQTLVPLAGRWSSEACNLIEGDNTNKQCCKFKAPCQPITPGLNHIYPLI